MTDSPHAAPPAVLLDLDINAPQREVIKISGESFTLRRADDLSIHASIRVSQAMPRIHALSEKPIETVTPEEEDELSTLLLRVVDQVLVAPLPILEKLTVQQRMRIVTVFFQRRPPATPAETTDAAAAATTTQAPGTN